MSTSFSSILSSEVKLKNSLIVEKGLGTGVRSVDSFKVVEATPNTLQVTIKAGVYIYEPDYIVWMDSDAVLDTFTTAASPRSDFVYIDVVADTGSPVFAISEGVWPPSGGVPAGHTYIPLWRIARTTGDIILQGDIDSGEDLRVVPPAVNHDHNYAVGAKDLALLVSKAEITQVLQGSSAHPTLTAVNLAKFTASNATTANLNELVGLGETVLHKHNSANSIQTPSGTAAPVAGLLKLAQTGQMSISASGDTITFSAPSDNLGNHTATQDLNMVQHKIMNVLVTGQTPPLVGDPTDWMEVANIGYVNTAIGGGLTGFAKYLAEANFNLSNTYKITNLKDGTTPLDAINKGQLDTKLSTLITDLGLDDRYKVGLQGDPNLRLNQKAWGNFNLSGYKVVNSGTISKLDDTRPTLSTKGYVDDEITELREDLEAQIGDFFTNPASEDLNMSGFRVTTLSGPLLGQDATNKDYVEGRIADVIAMIPTEPGAPITDNLGNHVATMDLNMSNYRVYNAIVPGQVAGDLTPNDKTLINKKYLEQVLAGQTGPDLTGFAKIGPTFEGSKNTKPLHMDVPNGGEVNVRGTSGKQLFVIKKKTGAPGEEVVINSRIQGVEDPIDLLDAVNKSYVDKKMTTALSVIPVGLKKAWTPLTLAAGFTALTSSFTPAYCLDAMNFVHLRGGCQGTSGSSVLIATLPAEFAPAKTSWFLVDQDGNSIAAVEVFPSGEIRFVSTYGVDSSPIHIDGLTWYIEPASAVPSEPFRDWTPITLEGGFTPAQTGYYQATGPYAPPAFRVSNGNIELRGGVNGATAPTTAATVAFTLPVGARPKYQYKKILDVEVNIYDGSPVSCFLWAGTDGVCLISQISQTGSGDAFPAIDLSCSIPIN